jgi:O-antigen ligase/polysaccharide polymerase Wzy-like membrane protein
VRARASPTDLLIVGGGAAATLIIAFLAVSSGAEVGVGLPAAVALFIGAVAAFVLYPHLSIAATVVLFALVPMLKVLVLAEVGVVKDAVVVAAVVAAAIVFVFDRPRFDRRLLILVGILLGLYVINVGSGHGVAWGQGVRLTGEPLVLLLVGLILPEPRRTFRWALGALIGTACLVAGYGIVQQIVGKYTLVDWGYSFEDQVRSLPSGQLRSFGTFDDPFAYAAFLLYGLGAVCFWLRRGPLAWGAGALILVGILFSFSRTAALILVAFIGLALWRRRLPVTATMVVVAIVLTAALILVNAGGTQSKTVIVAGNPDNSFSANVILNGRISAWSAALGDNPADWVLGRGVGEVGTAAERSTYTVTRSSDSDEREQAVDSGYLATIADVGFVGLGVLLALFALLAASAIRAARRGLDEGWVGLALLATLLLDALTRASFTGFPTAFLGLLLVGVAIASADDEAGGGHGTAGRRR